jgi:RNA polymerase sigma factor (sigma-70 family)
MNREADTLRTNWSLLAQLKNLEDQESWRRFYDLYRDVIIGVGRKAGLRADEAEVALQETMASVSKNIGAFEANPARGSFHAWLFTLAGWRIKDQVKKRLRSAQSDSDSGEGTARTPTVERVPDPRAMDVEVLLEADWREQLFAQALKVLEVQLTAPTYQAFHLLAVQGKSVAETAELLGKSRAQLYLIKHRVTRALSKIIKKLETELG